MKRLLLFVLGFYKRGISPLMAPACRFVPSCSDHAAEAVARHGALKGSILSIGRLLRCHPFSQGGLDLVPMHFHIRSTGKNSSQRVAACSHHEQAGLPRIIRTGIIDRISES